MSAHLRVFLSLTVIAQSFGLAPILVDTAASSTSTTSVATIEEINFSQPFDDSLNDLAEEALLLEQLQLRSPRVGVKYHYHYENREEQDRHTMRPKFGCGGAPRKTSPKVVVDGNYDHFYSEADCDPTPSPSTSSVLEEEFLAEEPTSDPRSSRSTVSPTTRTTRFPAPTSTPSDDVLETNEQSFSNTSASYGPINVETRTTASKYSGRNGSSSSFTSSNTTSSVGRSYWFVGAALCIVAFLGGFASSKFCMETLKSAEDRAAPTVTNLDSAAASESSSASTSFQLSVVENKDSVDGSSSCWSCEDWSVSVVSWTPLNEGVEVVETKRKGRNRFVVGQGCSNESLDEIEIEFESRDHDGHDQSYDEEDPPLFDVIDLNSRASF